MNVLAIPVAGLIMGVALGLMVSGGEAPWASRMMVVLLGLIAALASGAFAMGRGEGPWLVAGVGLVFLVGGLLLGADAWRRAWRSPLSEAFDRAARSAVARAGPSRSLPGGAPDRAHGTGVDKGMGDAPEARAVRAVVTGTLKADAAVHADYVTLRVSVQTFEATTNDGRVFDGRTLELPTKRDAVTGGIDVSVNGDLAVSAASAWRRGRTVRFPALLRRPAGHRNPGMAFDEVRSLARRGTVLVGSVKSGALVNVLARGSPWSEAGASLRAAARRVVNRHVGRWSQRAAAIVLAILIGDRAGLAAAEVRQLQEAGTYHTIAISGGNIAILAALTLALFRWSGVLGRAAMLAAIVAFLGYAEVVEGGASVVRAVVMAIAVFAARALDHRIQPAQALVLAAGGLVVTDPLVLADPGFILSFGATAAIVAMGVGWRERGLEVVLWGERFTAPTSRGRRVIAHSLLAAAGIVAASVAAEVALLPIGALYFGRVTTLGVGANLIAVPAMAVAQIAGMALVPIAIIVHRLPLLSDAVGGVAAAGAVALLDSAAIADRLPRLFWRVARPSAVLVVVYYAALALSVWMYVRRAVPVRLRRLVVLIVAGTGGWIAFEPWTVWVDRGDGRLHVLFIDVGQGDATFVRFPRGDTLLVDAGGSRSTEYDVGDRVVAPVLAHYGVRRLHTLAVSHGDQDHAGGAATVLRDFRPVDVWEGVPVPGWPVLAELRRLAADRGARWTNVSAGSHVEIDGVDVDVLHPPPADWERPRPRNDDSVVLELTWRDVSVLLTGDMEQTTEQVVAGHLAPVRWRIVKVPHHGSRTSSTEAFIDAARPNMAVISAGRDNPFGHPAPDVLNRYVASHAVVFETAKDGAVMLETDGWAVDVQTTAGRHVRLPATRLPDGRSPP